MEGGPRTRSRAKVQAEQWDSVPMRLKLFVLTVDALAEAQAQLVLSFALSCITTGASEKCPPHANRRRARRDAGRAGTSLSFLLPDPCIPNLVQTCALCVDRRTLLQCLSCLLQHTSSSCCMAHHEDVGISGPGWSRGADLPARRRAASMHLSNNYISTLLSMPRAGVLSRNLHHTSALPFVCRNFISLACRRDTAGGQWRGKRRPRLG